MLGNQMLLLWVNCPFWGTVVRRVWAPPMCPDASNLLYLDSRMACLDFSNSALKAVD